MNIATLLTSIQILMNEPNPDDPLMADIVGFILLFDCKILDFRKFKLPGLQGNTLQFFHI